MKKTFAFAALAAILSVVGFGMSSAVNSSEEIDGVLLANVEALTNDENGGTSCHWLRQLDMHECPYWICDPAGNGALCE